MTFVGIGLAPLVGLQVATLLILWVVVPVSLFLDSALMAEHGEFLKSDDFWTAARFFHSLVLIVGSVVAILLGTPVAFLVGAPIFALQYRLRLLGPVSFFVVGIALGFVCATLFHWLNPPSGMHGPYNYTFEIFIVASSACGWLFFWFVRRPALDVRAKRLAE